LICTAWASSGSGRAATVQALVWMHALYPVAARFELELAVGAVAHDTHHHLLVAADLACAFAHDLAAPALALGVAGVQAQQVAREKGRFVTASAGPDFQEHVAHVVGVAWKQQLLQCVFEGGQLRLDGRDLLTRHVRHLRVGGHLLRAREVGLALAITRIQAGDLTHFGMLARERAQAFEVLSDLGLLQEEIEFLQAYRIAFELLAEKGLHGGSGQGAGR
jgi:hypothetical protein